MKQVYVIFVALFLFLCLGLFALLSSFLRFFNVPDVPEAPEINISETKVSDILKVGDREFYLTISGHTYHGGWGGDGPFEYDLTMNIVTGEERIQKWVWGDNETTEEEVRNKIQKGYSLVLGDEIPHIFVKHDGRDMGFFHVVELRFVIARRPFSSQNIRNYAIELEKAESFVPQQIDLSQYDSFYYVNEPLGGARSKTLFSNDVRSLIILGTDFTNHCPVYTKGDVCLSDEAHLMSEVVSENTVFIVDSEKTEERYYKSRIQRDDEDIIGKEIVIVQE